EEAQLRFVMNLGLLFDIHDSNLENTNNVSDDMRTLFESLETSKEGSISQDEKQYVKSMLRVLDEIRFFGILKADIYHLYDAEIKNKPSLDFKEHGISDELLKNVPASLVSPHLGSLYDNASEAFNHLYEVYTGPIAYQYMHINDSKERQWLKETIENQ